jgi:transcriptional regulator with XRE-family HTH domain
MDTIGQKIRETLKSRHMKSRDLAEMIGLNPGTVDNIIYGRSRKYSWLKLISNALNIELVAMDDAANNNYMISYMKPVTLDLDLYSAALQMVTSYLKQNGVAASKDVVDLFSTITYDFMIKGYSSYDIQNCIHGMVALARTKNMVVEQKKESAEQQQSRLAAANNS